MRQPRSDMDRVLRVLAEAYGEALHGSISDGGGGEPMNEDRGAELILEILGDNGFRVVPA